MASLRPAFIQLGGCHQAAAPHWQQLRHMLQSLQISPKARHARLLSTTTPRPDVSELKDDTVGQGLDAARMAAAKAAIRTQSGEDAEPEARAQPAPWTGRGILAGRRFGDFKDFSRHDQSMDRSAGRRWWQGPGSTGEPIDQDGQEEDNGEMSDSGIHARILPVSPSYFSRQTVFNDSYLKLQRLMRQYAHLPTVPSDQIERVAFRTLKDFRLSVGEDTKASEYARCMSLVKRLHKIHPKLQPASVKAAIATFKRDINPHNHKGKDIPIDKFGRTLGVGKRKTSTARAWVVEGTGEVLVNGKSLADAFGRVHDRESAVWALKSTARTDKYNVWALVDGGGTTGQAEALAMAVGKALMAHEPALKPALRRAGVVTRDPRGVERKKAGHLKARKSPAWVKR